MVIGNRVGVLVEVTVGLAVAVGTGVLLGGGVGLGLSVKLGATVVALEDAVGGSRVTFTPFTLHPHMTNMMSNPKDNPTTTLNEFLCLPINKSMFDSFGRGCLL
jgi:UDP-3-O-[3-hydroxymyristoyl] glucosamine N-acyltransferase